MITRLCAWRPFRPIELAALLQMRPDKLSERHLSPMTSQGLLARVHPDNPSHPEQAYRATHTELPISDEAAGDDEDTEP